MDIKSIIKTIRDRLARKNVDITTTEPINGDQAIRNLQIEVLAEQMLVGNGVPIVFHNGDLATETGQPQNRHDRSCYYCKYHHHAMCAVNPFRSSDFYSVNDCKHWELCDRLQGS